ncbi:MAG: HAD-IB family hydrolase [Chloroflexota bacterium]
MKVAFFDVDGTLTNKPIWEGLIEYFKSKGKIPLGSIIFRLYLWPLYFLYKLKLLPQTSFRKPWAKHLPWYFMGMSVVEAEEMWDWILTEYIPKIMREDSLGLVQKHLGDGDLVVFISASPEPIIKRIAEYYGVSHVVATRPKQKRGKYSGGVEGDVCMGENKVKMALAYLDEVGVEVDMKSSYAYADSPGDVYLLEMVGNPVATHPDSDLTKIVKGRNWEKYPPQ